MSEVEQFLIDFIKLRESTIKGIVEKELTITKPIQIELKKPTFNKVKSVEISWSENSYINQSKKNDISFPTLGEASDYLARASTSAPDINKGFDKTGFLITWQDGNTYEGQVNLDKSYVNQKNIISRHVKKFLNYVIEKDSPLISKDLKEKAKHLIENYQLGKSLEIKLKAPLPAINYSGECRLSTKKIMEKSEAKEIKKALNLPFV